MVTQDVFGSDVAEPEQVTHEGEFLRVIAPLDEARGYCLDIPGHLSSVQLDSPLQAHTCKHGIWNQDGRFDMAALENGTLRMPHYELMPAGREQLDRGSAPPNRMYRGRAPDLDATRLGRTRFERVSSEVYHGRRGTE